MLPSWQDLGHRSNSTRGLIDDAGTKSIGRQQAMMQEGFACQASQTSMLRADIAAPPRRRLNSRLLFLFVADESPSVGKLLA